MIDDWFYVYPRGDKLDLTDEIRPIAAFEVEAHALEYAKKWPQTAEVTKGPRESTARSMK